MVGESQEETGEKRWGRRVVYNRPGGEQEGKVKLWAFNFGELKLYF